jgi:voltage-gated potassium channel
MPKDSADTTGRNTLRYRLYEILEIGAVDDAISTVVDRLMIALIVANVLAVILETVPAIEAQYADALAVFESVSIAIFSVEYLARLWISVERSHVLGQGVLRSRLGYIISPMALIDLAAILPFFLAFIVPDLRVLRIIRLLRLFKLVRYSPALVTLGRVIRNERRALIATIVVILSLVVIAGSIIYYLERAAQPDSFGHIPQAMWWAIATLTTVGYGDIVPVTDIGRLFGGIVMLFGLGMYALPIGIIASGFANEIGQRDFAITWHALVRVPIFSHLDAEAIAGIVDLLKARIVMSGQMIARIGDPAEDMFFILSGEVNIQTRTGQFKLGPGEYFGEIALLTGAKRFGTARALTRCHLMSLSQADFNHLMLDNAQIRTAILDVVRSRIDKGTGIGMEISEKEALEIRESLDRISSGFA